MAILNSRPDLITFVYGPINSGKTELFQHIIDRLSEDFVVFYKSKGGRFIGSYEDFIDVLFEIDERRFDTVEEYVRAIMGDLKVLMGLLIPTNFFEKFLERRERGRDVFRYIENLTTELSKTKRVVLVIYELQVIGDLKIDDLMIY